MNKFLYVFTVVIFTLYSCVEPKDSFTKIPPGIWRGVLYLGMSEIPTTDKKDVTKQLAFEDELPFTFEVVYDNEQDFHLVIHNGPERIKVNNITYGRDRATAKDTITIDFPDYDTYISAIYEERVMEGYYHVNYRDGYRIKFKAVYGDSTRFKQGVAPPKLKLDGEWSTVFEPDTESSYNGKGIFSQKDSYVEGTFLTETGDFRYLEGQVVGDKLYLSAFDGAHAFLFKAKDIGDGKLNGLFKSGTHYTAPWVATKSKIDLKDPFQITMATTPDQPVKISLPNDEGKIISLSDAPYNGKPKIVEIMGTWCPNCKDATAFLKEFRTTPEGKSVEIISMAFERYKEESKNIQQLSKYKKASQIPWEIVLGGNFDKKEASKSLPYISELTAYPTLLFLDKNNRIKHIYTGFSGPATAEHQTFKKQFLDIIKTL